MGVPTRLFKVLTRGPAKVDTMATEPSFDPTATRRTRAARSVPSSALIAGPAAIQNSNNQPPINPATIFCLFSFLSVVIFSQCPISSVTITVCNGGESIDFDRRIPAAIVWTYYGKSLGKREFLAYTISIKKHSRRHCRTNKTISDFEVGFYGCNITTIWPLPFPLSTRILLRCIKVSQFTSYFGKSRLPISSLRGKRTPKLSVNFKTDSPPMILGDFLSRGLNYGEGRSWF